MTKNRHNGLVIVGTDTGVGKTQVTRWIAHHLTRQNVAVGICKPAVTGARHQRDGNWVWDDLEVLRSACPLAVTDDWICPYRWITPLSPPMADKVDSTRGYVDFPGYHSRLPSIAEYMQTLDERRKSCEFLLVEGIGGILCPLTMRETFIDLACGLAMPLVVVGHLGLGTINHTLLTLAAAEAHGLRVACIVLNRPTDRPDEIAEQTNRQALLERTEIPVLDPLPFQVEVDPIPHAILSTDWLDLASK
jgi:dethiobiotin synthetase